MNSNKPIIRRKKEKQIVRFGDECEAFANPNRVHGTYLKPHSYVCTSAKVTNLLFHLNTNEKPNY